MTAKAEHLMEHFYIADGAAAAKYVPCPFCQAPMLQPCVSKAGTFGGIHMERWQAYQNGISLAVPVPAEPPPEVREVVTRIHRALQIPCPYPTCGAAVGEHCKTGPSENLGGKMVVTQMDPHTAPWYGVHQARWMDLLDRVRERLYGIADRRHRVGDHVTAMEFAFPCRCGAPREFPCPHWRDPYNAPPSVLPVSYDVGVSYDTETSPEMSPLKRSAVPPPPAGTIEMLREVMRDSDELRRKGYAAWREDQEKTVTIETNDPEVVEQLKRGGARVDLSYRATGHPANLQARVPRQRFAASLKWFQEEAQKALAKDPHITLGAWLDSLDEPPTPPQDDAATPPPATTGAREINGSSAETRKYAIRKMNELEKTFTAPASEVPDVQPEALCAALIILLEVAGVRPPEVQAFIQFCKPLYVDEHFVGTVVAHARGMVLAIQLLREGPDPAAPSPIKPRSRT